MSSFQDIIKAVEYYNKITNKYREFKIIDEKYISYYSPECPNMYYWNTAFHYEKEHKIHVKNLKLLYDFYSSKSCNGYLFSYTDDFKEFSVFHGSIFYIDKNFIQFDKIVVNENYLKLIQTNDMEEFTRQVDSIFSIGELARKELSKLLTNSESENCHQSYYGFYKEKFCAIVTIIHVDQDRYYIFNLGVFPEFRNLGIAKKIINFLIKNKMNKEICISTEYKSILSQKILPELGFKHLGDHHLLDLAKLYEHIQ